MNKFIFSSFLILLTLNQASANDLIARGRYLTLIGGCNDCHTSGFAQNQGHIAESEWLKGDSIGWKGPWGTTYPINLRNLVSRLSNEQWINFMRNSKARPPMPAYVTTVMPEEDLSALYAFIRTLGPAGENAPDGLAPGVEPKTPYFNLEPVVPVRK